VDIQKSTKFAAEKYNKTTLITSKNKNL